MTDREKLIALIKEGECGALGREDCSYCKYDGEDDCSYQLLADVLLANGVTFATDNYVGGKWIPVTERLPEYGEIVLAFGKRHATSGMFRGTGLRPSQWEWKGNMYKEVSHWMPLPEPPKEGE